MRRQRPTPAARGFRASDWMRIFSMILLLAVLYMLWDWARDPTVWRFFAEEPGAAVAGAGQGGEAEAEPAGVPAPAPEPAAAGPTDEDPEQRTAIVEEFQAVTDKTLQIQPEEMFAYRRVLDWVLHQPASVMRKRARTDLTFNDFMLSPDKLRGALVEMVLNARLVRECDLRAVDGGDLYEVWGFTTDSGSWLYSTIVVGIREGMPVGSRVDERVRFVGYFFKLQGYHEASAKPRSPPLVAPMFIGRLIWIHSPAPAKRTFDASWSLILLAVFGLLIVAQVAWLVLRPRRRRSGLKTGAEPRPGTAPIEQWFERAEQGTAPIPDDPQSESTTLDESSRRDPDDEGDGNAGPRHQLDGGAAGEG